MDINRKYFKYKKKYLTLKNNQNGGKKKSSHNKIKLSKRTINRLSNLNKIKVPRKLSRDKALTTDDIEKGESIGFPLMRIMKLRDKYGKQSVYDKILNYLKKIDPENFYKNSLLVDARNSRPVMDENEMKKHKGFIFQNNDGKKYVTLNNNPILSVQKNTIAWNLDDRFKKHKELKEIGLHEEGVRFKKMMIQDIWFYLLIFAYFHKGIGQFSMVPRKGQAVYFMFSKIKKI